LFEYQCKIEVVAILRTKGIVRERRTLHNEGRARSDHYLRDKDVESALGRSGIITAREKADQIM
jgi:hypothetical protein